MIALSLSPVKDMMHVQLWRLLGTRIAEGAPVLVSALYELADSVPALPATLLAATLPVRAFVSSATIHRVSGAATCIAEAGSSLGRILRGRVELGVRCAMLAIAGLVTEQASSMRLLALIDSSAVGTFNLNAALAELGIAASGAEARGTGRVIITAERRLALFASIGLH